MRSLLPVFIITTLILSACSAGKKAFEQGDYYKSVITSVDRLRSKPNHKKAGETLRNAYPLAVKYYVNRADNALASNSQNKWKTVVDSYTTINSMFEQINRSPGALRVIPDPVNYYDQLETAKNNAANEAYKEAEIAFGKGTREGAREAVGLFRQAQYFVPNYKDTNQRIEDALWAATLKVVVEPIPIAANSLEISADFFQNKITEYLHSQQVNEFVRFFTPEEAVSMNLGVPDQVIELSFDEFSVGDVYFKEREVQAVNDSVVVATYYTDAPAAASSLSTGGAGAVGASGAASTGNTVSSGNSSGSSGNVNTTTPQKANTGRQAVGTQRTYDYSKKPSGSGQTTPAPSSGGQTTPPPTSGGQTTPPPTSGGQTAPPPTSGGQTTPPPSTGGQTTPPPTSGGQTTPPPTSGGQTTPPPTSGGQTTPPPNDGGKVTICHKTGNGYKTITINKNALQAHLKHGDLMGECPATNDTPPPSGQNPPPDNNDGKPDTPAADANTKVTICHKTGNGYKTITVNMNALQAHLDHGDTMGACPTGDNNSGGGNKSQGNSGNGKKNDDKSNGNNGKGNSNKKGNSPGLSLVTSDYGQHGGPGDHLTIVTTAQRDTVPPGKIEHKVYASVKATVYEFTKTLTSRGVLDFRIIDPNSGKVLTQEKLPGEYIWVSEWATFNGDERALDERQKRLVQLREAPAPGPQDLFIEFTAPIYQQIIGKVNNYYRGF